MKATDQHFAAGVGAGFKPALTEPFSFAEAAYLAFSSAKRKSLQRGAAQLPQ